MEWLKRSKGNAGITIKMNFKKLNNPRKRTKLWNILETQIFIQDLKRSDSYKEALEHLFNGWCRCQGLEFKSRKYKREHELPLILTEVELEQLISSFRFEYATVCRVMKETGASVTEAS